MMDEMMGAKEVAEARASRVRVKSVVWKAGIVGVVAGVAALGVTVWQVQRSTSASKALASGGLPSLNYQIRGVIGQPNERETMTNLITNDRGFHLGGVQVDGQGRIFVFDSGNNRILGFANYSMDRPADIVIGQTGMDAMGTTNGDNTRYNSPTDRTLALLPYPHVVSVLESPNESQMATDALGNLFVLDTNNNRVLKFNDPFGTDSVADEVWGQPDFTTRLGYCHEVRQPTAATFCTESGNESNGFSRSVYMTAVEIDPAGNLWVADVGNNRVMRFPNSGGTIAKTADVVLGQGDFGSWGARDSFDTNLTKLRKPISLKFHPTTGELYVLEGEFPGTARIAVFAPPFSSGMTATREMGRAMWQDSKPTDQTNWTEVEGKWVKYTTGLNWARGMTFDPSGAGLWVNDGGSNRMVYFTTEGVLTAVLGQPDLDTVGCYGWTNQGFIDLLGSRQNLCEPGGGIGLGPDGAMWVATNGGSDQRSIIRFALPVQRNGAGLAMSNGRLLHFGMNKYSGKTFANGYGMAITTTDSGIQQVFASDHQRVMVWNNPASLGDFPEATYIVGQDAPDQNQNNNGSVFSGIDLGAMTTGGGYLWVAANDRIFAFTLPITGGGRNYLPYRTLFTGTDPVGNVVWADDTATKVLFRASGLAYDPTANALWVSDADRNRVLRIANPLGPAVVDLVLGQSDKAASADNAGTGGPSAQGFGDPWALQFDRLGNLYVVDSKFEGGVNNRVLRFAASSLVPAGNIFPMPAATGVYAKQGFNTLTDWGPGTPARPTFVTFDSQNRMLMLVDGYGNKQYERVFLYPSSHAGEATPQPEYVLPLATGQVAFAAFYQGDNRLLIQDHTWNRILDLEISVPTPTPAPLSSSSPTPTPTLIPHYSLQFDGINDGVRGPDLPLVTTFTMEAWVKRTVDRNGYESIMSDANNNYSLAMFTLYVDGKNQDCNGVTDQFAYFQRANNQKQCSGVRAELNRWYHLAVVRDSSGARRFFVDGQLVSTKTNSTAPTNSPGNFTLGRAGDFNQEHFGGRVDEVRISSVARYTGTFVPQKFIGGTDADTMLLWHADAGTGQVVEDFSGNNRNGTLGPTTAVEPADAAWSGDAP